MPPPDLIGTSQAIAALRDEIDCAAPTNAKVLITGESGVGKEVVARQLHSRSRRAAAPFMSVNCAGVPETLLESELFGYTQGSFTGALRDKPGLLMTLDGGTVFLDEVGEMSPRMQALLLRFLETGEIQRVGSTTTRTSNVRVLAATNRDLASMSSRGEFRADLYYRLNVLPLHVPPLREHREDIPALASYWVTRTDQLRPTPPQLSRAAVDAMCAYAWPGNVRELRNVIEAIVIRTTAPTIELGALPRHLCSMPAAPPVATIPMNPCRQLMLDSMLGQRQSFWQAVYQPFLERDITRDDLRWIVRQGLERSQGSYKVLVALFNMPADDYKRFLNFLRKHDCHVPFHTFRVAHAELRVRPIAYAAG